MPPVLGIWKPKGIRGKEPDRDGLADKRIFENALILLIDLTTGANTAKEEKPMPKASMSAHKACDGFPLRLLITSLYIYKS